MLPAVEKLSSQSNLSGGNRWYFQQTKDVQDSLQKITQIPFWQGGHHFASKMRVWKVGVWKGAAKVGHSYMGQQSSVFIKYRVHKYSTYSTST